MANWDFQLPDHALSTAQFVSSPTSLHLTPPHGSTLSVLCTVAGTDHLPQGRISSQLRADHPMQTFGFLFRNISPLGGASHVDTYAVIFDLELANVRISRFLSGVPTVLATRTLPFAFGTVVWRLFRITWWYDAGTLLIRTEHHNGTTWVTSFSDVSDPAPKFGASTILRTGLCALNELAASSCFFDDTRIYRPT